MRAISYACNITSNFCQVQFSITLLLSHVSMAGNKYCMKFDKMPLDFSCQIMTLPAPNMDRQYPLPVPDLDPEGKAYRSSKFGS